MLSCTLSHKADAVNSYFGILNFKDHFDNLFEIFKKKKKFISLNSHKLHVVFMIIKSKEMHYHKSQNS